MFYPTLQTTENTKDMTSAFLGYNHNEVINPGELYETHNLTADFYPLMAPRKKRSICLNVADEEWRSLPVSYSGSFHGDITTVNMTYSGTAQIEERNVRHKIVIRMDPKLVKNYTVVITETGEKGEEEPKTYTRSGAEETFIFTPEETTEEILINITAFPVDATVWDETRINDCITGIEFFQLNDVVRGMVIKQDKLCYMIGETLYYDGERYDYSEYLVNDDHTKDVQMISFGALILIFPQGLYFNTQTKETGALGNKASVTGEIKYSVSDRDGKSINATESDTAPENPEDGDYWLNTKTNGLYLYSKTLMRWETVSTTYIRIDLPGKISGFKKGDAVAMDTKLPDINKASIIQSIGETWLVVIGLLDSTSDSETKTLTIERKIPKMDYVCATNNRVWGCYCGEIEDSVMVNEIYSCKLGDPTNWNVFSGLSTDSYSLSIGSDGVFTGAIAYNGYPTFFKENVVYKIYGSYPSAYQLYTYEMRGVERGSERSLAIVGSYLVYKSVDDICVFDGNSASSISDKLGSGHYSDAAAGSCVNKYYISMKDDETGEYELFIYDLSKGLWMHEDNLRIHAFAYTNTGALYGLSGLLIYGFERADDDFALDNRKQEEYVEWAATSGKLGLAYPDTKRLQKIIIRAAIPYKSEIRVEVAYNGKEFEPVTTVRGQKTAYSYEVNIPPLPCDYYQLRLSGHGDVHIYSIAYMWRREKTT